MADQQGALQRHRHRLGQPARGGLGRVGDVLAEPGDRLVEAAVRARGGVEFGEERLRRLRLPGQGADPVERGHVA